jgi:oxygen-independent coproporphyrinogen-3 oxidase
VEASDRLDLPDFFIIRSGFLYVAALGWGMPSSGTSFSHPAVVLPDVSAEVLARYGKPAPRYTSYPPIPAWSRSIGPAEYGAALEAAADPATGPLSVYVHLPFCPQRCLYCGCNVTITRREETVDRYLDRLEQELGLVTRQLGPSRRAVQLHLGGGTPNHLDPTRLARLRAMLDRHFDLDGAEAGIEIDPRLLVPGRLAAIRELGFDRVSFGVQDLDPVVQRAIGRVQPFELVQRSIDDARTAGFDSVNVDLIYGLPEQTLLRFARTIESVVELGPDRIACFGYAHVPKMQPHQRALERYGHPDTIGRFALNRLAIEGFTAAGYAWVGLDHFVRPGDPLARAAATGTLYRNFNGYTTMPATHLVAVGMSAIGEVAGWQVQNDAELPGWHAAIERGELATVRGHRLTDDDYRRRAAILSLMCDLTLPASRAAGLEREVARLAAYAADGLVEHDGADLRVTPLGRVFLRTLCTAFDAYLPAATAPVPMSQAV